MAALATTVGKLAFRNALGWGPRASASGPKWGIATNRSQIATAFASAQYFACKISFKTYTAVTKIKVIMPFWYIALGDIETNLSTGGTLYMWLEYPLGTYTPFTIGGNAAITIVPGSHATAVLDVVIPAAAALKIHSKWALSTTGQVPSNVIASNTSGDGRVTNAAAAAAYQPGDAMLTSASVGTAPLVLGYGDFGTTPTFLGFGDSIMYGQVPHGSNGGDALGNASWFEKLVSQSGFGVWNISKPGAMASVLYNGGNPSIMSKRLALLSEIQHKPIVVNELGHNDLASPGVPTALAACSGLNALMRSYSTKIVQTTLTPWTQNPFPAGGVGQADASSGAVTTFNNGVRGGSITNMDAILDLNGASRSAGSELLWDVTGGDPTADGIHPNNLGDGLIASRLRSSTSDVHTLLAALAWPGY